MQGHSPIQWRQISPCLSIMDPKRTQEICSELTELINLQCSALATSSPMSPEQAQTFALRRRKIDVLLAELDVLAARSTKT